MPYPSVTVCTDSIFKIYIDELLYSNSTLAETEELVKSNIWKRNETFYFVNQKLSDNDDFPCMTSSESNDPGRPCIFPFNINISTAEQMEILGLKNVVKTTHYNCTLLYNPQLWCYTKVDKESNSMRAKLIFNLEISSIFNIYLINYRSP